MKKIMLAIVVVIFIGAVIMFPRMKLYFIRADGGGGDLLWRNNEAYLFLYDAPIGYRLTGADWLAEPIRERFQAPAIPDTDVKLLAIFRVTPSGVERHIQKCKVSIGSFTVFGDTIYASCPGGICKWTGSQFELITNNEEQSIGGRDHLSNDWSEFTNVNGWSKRLIRSVGPGETPIHDQFSIDVGKDVRLLVTEGNPTSVDLQPLNQSSDRIWYYKRGTSMVSKAKYNSVFGQMAQP
jgi:hypothetical protein